MFKDDRNWYEKLSVGDKLDRTNQAKKKIDKTVLKEKTVTKHGMMYLVFEGAVEDNA